MIDKDLCLSSYIAYRYIYRDDVDFYEGFSHEYFKPIEEEKRLPVSTCDEMDYVIQKSFEKLYKEYDNIGILLSGGMDSAIIATYLKPGSHAYTFDTNLSNVYNEDVARAKNYCERLNLKHTLVNIDFDDYKMYTPVVMNTKGAPVHSIEPQIYKAAIQAKKDGVQLIIVGESADLIFGGMDKLISKDWTFEDFSRRYTFLEPGLVLSNPIDVSDLYEKYRQGDKIDFMTFMDEVFSIESSSSYLNAFKTAGIKYYDPYAQMIMKEPLDLERVRNGEPKYLVRELFAKRYPGLPIPDKIPMPRPVDEIFKDWSGPTREEFRKDIEMSSLSGNQKWQLWCAELFLIMYD